MRNTSRISFLFLICLTMLSLTVACGDKSGDKTDKKTGPDSAATPEVKDDFAEKCKSGNAISVTIKDYGYQMKGKYSFETGNFEVKQSSWMMLNDSTAVMKLSNYTAEELVGDRKDEQVDILVKLSSKKGKKIEAGAYPYQKYESDLSSGVNMITSKGTVWFNWVADMPEQGNVMIDYASKDKACGSFMLAVEKPGNDMIGTVRLNGTFKIGE